MDGINQLLTMMNHYPQPTAPAGEENITRDEWIQRLLTMMNANAKANPPTAIQSDMSGPSQAVTPSPSPTPSQRPGVGPNGGFMGLMHTILHPVKYDKNGFPVQ